MYSLFQKFVLKEMQQFWQDAFELGFLPTVKAYTLKYRIIVKFIVSGVVGALTMLFLLAILTEVFNLWYLTSAIISYLLAATVSFALHKFWTFRDKNIKAVNKQAQTFLLVHSVIFILNTVGIYVLVDIVGIWYLLSQIILSGLLAILSFFIYRFRVFTTSRYDTIIQNPDRISSTNK